VKLEYKKGCMLPAATNFDPDAKQSGTCRFATAGCTTSLALKYNPDATIDDGSCVAKEPGCTVNSVPYAGVDSNTPGYRSGWHGTKFRSPKSASRVHHFGVGKHDEYLTSDEYLGTAVVSYDSNANVMSICTVSIEGCMDSSMVNYDVAATVNSNTWCIPRVPGCMMPSTDMAKSGAALFPSSYDGLAKNFQYDATVDEGCIVERQGCNVSTALNYDPLATTEGTSGGTKCWYSKTGCLNPAAKNTGCEERSDDKCPDSGVTYHVGKLCKWTSEAVDGTPAPPSPPPPSQPSGSYTKNFAEKISHAVAVEFTIAGGLETHGTGPCIKKAAQEPVGASSGEVEMKTPGSNTTVFGNEAKCVERAERQLHSTTAGHSTTVVRRELQSGGSTTTVGLTLTFASSTARDAGKATLEAAMSGSLEDLNAFLGAIPGLEPVTVASVESIDLISYEETGGLTGIELNGIIAGAAIGGFLCLCVLPLLVIRMKMKKSKETMVVPA
jgi:hypothetical protein